MKVGKCRRKEVLLLVSKTIGIGVRRFRIPIPWQNQSFVVDIRLPMDSVTLVEHPYRIANLHMHEGMWNKNEGEQ